MCRLFGFRSVLTSQIHSSLMHADNALAYQSNQHPDGWGVAYYLANAPHIVKSVKTAVDDHLFKKVSGIVTSQTILAHLRKATIGDPNYINTHPFQYGRWVFGHNGNIKDFAKHRDKISKLIDPDLARFILGATDSELLFFLLMSYINKVCPLHGPVHNYDLVKRAITNALQDLIEIIGPCLDDDLGNPQQTYLTFILTDGKLMFGLQAGKALHYSTHKERCPERDTCSFFNNTCETKVPKGPVNHLIFSSEPIEGENEWTAMECGMLIGVDEGMNLDVSSVGITG